MILGNDFASDIMLKMGMICIHILPGLASFKGMHVLYESKRLTQNRPRQVGVDYCLEWSRHFANQYPHEKQMK